MVKKYSKKHRRAPFMKKFHKKKRNTRNSASISRLPPTIVSDRAITRLKYNKSHLMVSAGGGPVFLVYRGNSIFDPEFATGGLQPPGFDQWMDFYQRFIVHASKIKVGFTTAGTDAQSQVARCCIIPTPNVSNPFTTYESAAANPYSKVTQFTIGDITSLKSYMSTAKIMGLPGAAVEIREEFEGSSSGNPSNEWLWIVCIQPQVPSQGMTVLVNLTIDYYVEFRGRQGQFESELPVGYEDS